MQIYLSSDWELNKKSIRIAEKYGFAGIVLTVDGQILGVRRR